MNNSYDDGIPMLRICTLMMLLVILMISGCASQNTKFVKVSYPILVCPAPPIIDKPQLYINELTIQDAGNYSKVVKYYEITLEQLTNHIKKLELVIDRYNKTSESYKEIEKDVAGMVQKTEELK